MRKIEPFEKCAECGCDYLYFCYDEDRWELIQVCYDCGMIHMLGTVPPAKIMKDMKGKKNENC